VALIAFRIRYPDGKQEALTIDADRALVGSGAHCEIRLPVDAARVEHVSVQVSSAGVFAQALAFDPPPLVNGLPFTQGTILPDTVMVIGNVEVEVRIEDAAAGPVVKAGEQKTSPMTMVLAALLIPLAGFVLLMDDGEQGAPPPPKDVPKLWAEPITTCQQTGAQGALAVAVEKNAIADAKRERSPFDVRDAVAAVPLYEIAAACFKQAGDPHAEDARQAADSLRARFTEEYRTHAVWLEHSLKEGDYRAAQREIAILLAFTEGKKGDYVTWLSNTERQLRVKYGQRTQ
jgi:hypothetical protein